MVVPMVTVQTLVSANCTITQMSASIQRVLIFYRCLLSQFYGIAIVC